MSNNRLPSGRSASVVLTPLIVQGSGVVSHSCALQPRPYDTPEPWYPSMRTPQSWICASGRAARLVDASRIAKALLPPLSFVATAAGSSPGT